MEPGRAPAPGVQQQQHRYSSFNVSGPPVNQSIHSQRNMNHIGGVGAVTTVGCFKTCKS